MARSTTFELRLALVTKRRDAFAVVFALDDLGQVSHLRVRHLSRRFWQRFQCCALDSLQHQRGIASNAFSHFHRDFELLSRFGHPVD